MKCVTKSIVGIIGRNSLKKLAAAALGICVLAPVAHARDHDHDQDVDFGVRADNHGHVDFGIGFFGGHDHVRERTERVWVDAVWKNEGRVWVEPVWEKVSDRVWCPPVTRDVCTRVWIEPSYEVRETTVWEHGRRIVRRERVEVAPGHYEERHSDIVVADGHWDTTDKWVLRSDGHFEGKDRWVCVSEGHCEDRVIREAPVVAERRVDVHFGGR